MPFPQHLHVAHIVLGHLQFGVQIQILVCFLFLFLQLERVQKRLEDRKIKIVVTEAAVELLGSLGYDPNYGARPVKRVIQQNVENELAKGILKGEFKDEDKVLIDTEVTAFSNGQLPQQKLVFRRLESGSETPEAPPAEASLQEA